MKWLWPWCEAVVAGDMWELGTAALTWCDPEGCKTGERVPGDGWTLALEVPAGGFCWGCPRQAPPPNRGLESGVCRGFV